ncbi:hypothetical protein LIER_02348 [Lithospermum erythrorhizon]|uniref:Uncharacterized protein n=1 Tax=Lithospermum erythrorhizon TaxID=34254 RepID=A0AAV3NQD2_LITER
MTSAFRKMNKKMEDVFKKIGKRNEAVTIITSVLAEEVMTVGLADTAEQINRSPDPTLKVGQYTIGQSK